MRPNLTVAADLERAQALVKAADINAVSLFVSMLDQFPSMRAIEPKRWDKVLAFAGIFVAISRLNHSSVAMAERDSLMNIVTKEALHWDARSVEALDDCRTFVERSYDAMALDLPVETDRTFLFSDALGIWIFWNLLNHSPSSDEERHMARVLGSSVVHNFHSWWDV